MVEENGSVRGREWVARICSPVRMCHPMSASASGRFDKGPASSDQKRKTKMMSRTEGWRKRRADELGCAGVIIGEEAVYKVFKVSRFHSFKEPAKPGAANPDVTLKL